MAGLRKFPKYNEMFVDGRLVLSPNNIEVLTNLVEVVVNKHFFHYQETEELVSVGILKCIELLQDGSFDPVRFPSPSALKNFLYTGVRNEVGNYVYHYKNNKKEVISEDSSLNSFELLDRTSILLQYCREFCKVESLNYLVFRYYLGEVGLLPKTSKPDIEFSEYDMNKYTILFIHKFFTQVV